MEEKENYNLLVSEIVAKQSLILGPDIAVLIARKVQELIIDGSGKVIEIKGDPDQALQKLVNEYVELSGLIVKNALGSIFAKYPTIKKVD